MRDTFFYSMRTELLVAGIGMGALRTGADGTDGAAVHLPFSAVENRLVIEAGVESSET